MSATTASDHGPDHATGEPAGHEGERRDFLKLLGASAAVIGVGAMAWPFIDSMNPSSDVLALSSIDVDITPVVPGMGITVVWQGKPVFIRRRTPEEIKVAQAVPLGQLLDPASDASRVKSGHDDLVVMIGICTHLGCVPLGNKTSDNRGDYGGYLCPCHGSQYDVAGRVRHGPAPANLALPPYAFTSDTKITIG